MDLLMLIIRIFLFGIFALAVIGKLLDIPGSKKAVTDFGVPASAASAAAWLLLGAEAVVAYLFLFPSTTRLAALIATLMLVVFVIGMAIQIQKGVEAECHCFGQIHSAPVGKVSLLRNLIFMALAVFLLIQGGGSSGYALGSNAVDIVQSTGVLTAVVIAFAALLYLKKLTVIAAANAKRVELLELLANDGRPIERDEAGLPHDGLPIGSPFPAFDLKTVGGKSISLEALRNAGRPALLIFVGTSCEPCRILLPEFESWRKEFSEICDVLLVSSGTLEENAEKIAPVFGGSILIDPDRRLALSLRAKWTPTALFMNSDGRVASFLAAGDASIRRLIDRIRDEHPAKPSAYFADDTEERSKIGERVPEFSLYAHDNRLVTESELIGARSLVVFWSPLCPHCQIMMSELRSWDATRRHDDPRLFVFSNGDSELHRELGLESPVLADPDHATAAKLGMYGTPSAVLVNERGEIASETATGIDNIWALIGKRK